MYATRACAKINLDLRVLGTRADGYHELRTIFQAVELSDTLTLDPADGSFALLSDDPRLPTGPTNLAVRGAQAVADALGRSLDGWRLHLAKGIPAEAGLGGGSADAVAAARLMLAAWGETWSRERLARTLAPVGADVPFFVEGGTALGRGRGDDLSVLTDLPARPVLLVRPDFGVSTRDAYAWFDAAPPPPPPPPLVLPASPSSWRSALARCDNDLEAAVLARHPALGDGLRRLHAAGAELARMSGSGSALMGIFPDEEAARAALGPWPDGWCTWLTRTLSRRTYADATRVVGPASPAGPLPESPAVV